MPSQPPRAPADLSVPILEERLEVGREVVQTGTVRVRKEVDETVQPVRERVANEVADVRRVPVNRVVNQPPAVRHEGDVMVVPVLRERLVLRKEWVLVEEVRISRRVEHALAEAQVTLRSERVVVERLDPATRQWLPEDGSLPPQPPPQER